MKFLKKLCKVLFTVVAVLFVVYFWNLDQRKWTRCSKHNGAV